MKTLMQTPARAAAIPIATVSSTVRRMSRLATWARPTPSPINSMSVTSPDTMRACGIGSSTNGTIGTAAAAKIGSAASALAQPHVCAADAIA
jgi:hypothetical protein